MHDCFLDCALSIPIVMRCMQRTQTFWRYCCRNDFTFTSGFMKGRTSHTVNYHHRGCLWQWGSYYILMSAKLFIITVYRWRSQRTLVHWLPGIGSSVSQLANKERLEINLSWREIISLTEPRRRPSRGWWRPKNCWSWRSLAHCRWSTYVL